jgi:hypothetical protein
MRLSVPSNYLSLLFRPTSLQLERSLIRPKIPRHRRTLAEGNEKGAGLIIPVLDPADTNITSLLA